MARLVSFSWLSLLAVFVAGMLAGVLATRWVPELMDLSPWGLGVLLFLVLLRPLARFFGGSHD